MRTPIAFMSDKHMLPGLHVSVASLLSSLSYPFRSSVELHLFLDGVSPTETKLLESTHQKFGSDVFLQVHEYSPKAPVGGNSLHGNQTTYGRLSLPYLLADHEKGVYLDSDLYINRCLSSVIDEIDDSHVVAVDGNKVRGESYDRKLFEAAQIPADGAYFNAGVMGINMALWRELDVRELCVKTADRFPGMFVTADQALLNVVLHDKFKSLGGEINHALFPNSPVPALLEKKIYHYVASPKPWDLFGRFASRHYPMWSRLYKETAIGHRQPWKYTSLARERSIAISVAKALRNRYF